MAKILQYRPSTPIKLGYKKSVQAKLETKGQLNLFDSKKDDSSTKSNAKLRSIPSQTPFDLALQMEEKGKMEEAIRYYKIAAKEPKMASNSLCNLGVIYASKEEDIKAVDLLSQALVIDPRHAFSHYNLGNIYLDQENYKLANLHYNMARNINPDFPEVYFNEALALIELKAFADALVLLQNYLDKTDQRDEKYTNMLINYCLASISRK